MGNKSDKDKQALLQQQQAQDRAREQALLDATAKPTQLENAQTAETQNWLDTTSGKNGPLDINNLTAMKPNLALYDNASRRQEGERMGIGALQMGAQNTNPGLTQLLRSQQDDQRQQNAAGQLENAYRMTDAQMRGDIMPLLSLNQNRSMGLAGMASNNANSSTGQYANFRVAPSFWQQLIMQGVKSTGEVGAAAAGKP